MTEHPTVLEELERLRTIIDLEIDYIDGEHGYEGAYSDGVNAALSIIDDRIVELRTAQPKSDSKPK